jgi:2'-5' RNA ligase
MRVFVAIDIGEQIRKGLGALQQQLQAKANVKRSDVKWVRPGSIHLTLKFLGEIKDDQLAEVCNIVKEVTARHKSFELEVGTVGFFGGRSARVLWLGCGEGNEALLQLQKDIEQQLSESGWPPEARKFTGHLTLCRVRNTRAGAILARLSDDYKDFQLGRLAADSVVVYQSELRPDGPIYTALARCELQ